MTEFPIISLVNSSDFSLSEINRQLETIFLISPISPPLAEFFKRLSVSRAIGILKSGGYVEMAEDGSLTLTESGHSVAEQIYERHTILTECLVRLGVDREIAAEDACKMEHGISDESMAALKKFIEA